MDVIANAMTNAIDAINTVVWGYILIYGLLAVGIYFPKTEDLQKAQTDREIDARASPPSRR